MNGDVIDNLALWATVGASSLGLLGFGRRSAVAMSLIGSVIAVGGACWLVFRCWDVDEFAVRLSLPNVAEQWIVTLSPAKAFVLLAHSLLVAVIARVQFLFRDDRGWWILAPVATNAALLLDDRLAAGMAFFLAVVVMNALAADTNLIWSQSARILAGLSVIAAALVALGRTNIAQEMRPFDGWPPLGVPQTLQLTAVLLFLSAKPPTGNGISSALYFAAMPMFLVIAMLFQFDSASIGARTAAFMTAAATAMALAWSIAAVKSKSARAAGARFACGLQSLAVSQWFLVPSAGFGSVAAIAITASGLYLLAFGWNASGDGRWFRRSAGVLLGLSIVSMGSITLDQTLIRVIDGGFKNPTSAASIVSLVGAATTLLVAAISGAMLLRHQSTTEGGGAKTAADMLLLAILAAGISVHRFVLIASTASVLTAISAVTAIGLFVAGATIGWRKPPFDSAVPFARPLQPTQVGRFAVLVEHAFERSLSRVFVIPEAILARKGSRPIRPAVFALLSAAACTAVLLATSLNQ